jgi:CRISPR-associated protein Cmr3
MRVERDGITVWEGVLREVVVTLIAACVGKPVKIGGWDLANGQPRDLTPFVPAGSVYFCEARAEDREKVSALHGTQIGRQVEYGFGHILVGAW